MNVKNGWIAVCSRKNATTLNWLLNTDSFNGRIKIRF